MYSLNLSNVSLLIATLIEAEDLGIINLIALIAHRIYHVLLNNVVSFLNNFREFYSKFLIYLTIQVVSYKLVRIGKQDASYSISSNTENEDQVNLLS